MRRFPASRRQPDMAADRLAGALAAAEIEYAPFPDLGGRRRPRPDSANTGWRNLSVRGYADYMETPEFDAALGRLLDLATRRRTAILCAEALWWRCHRALIADALAARGVEVVHILGPGPDRPHRLSAPARIEGGKVTYPGQDPESGSL